VVRDWHAEDYQGATLRRGRLLERARRGDWRELENMLGSLTEEGAGEVYQASLLRLLRGCDDERKLAVITGFVTNQSAWVRSAAVLGLGEKMSAKVLGPLMQALGDSSRGVRVRAGLALAAMPPGGLELALQAKLESAWGEVEAAYSARRGDPVAVVEFSGFLCLRGKPVRGAEEVERVLPVAGAGEEVLLRLAAAGARVQAGNVHAAETHLRRALLVAPRDAEVWRRWIQFLEGAGRVGDVVDARREGRRRLGAEGWNRVEQGMR
jgi:hypothetical protein